MSPGRPILVEFVGASGVGKSFLLARVSEILSKSGVEVHDLDAMRTRRLHPKNMLLVLKAAWLVLLTRPARWANYRGLVKRVAQDMIRRSAAAHGDGVHLCSEGPFQRTRALYRRSKGLGMDEIAEALFRHIRPPDVVVAVEASAQTIHRRRLARGRRQDTFTEESVASDVQLVNDSISAIEHVRSTIAPGLILLRINLEDSEITPMAEGLAKTLRDVSPANP